MEARAARANAGNSMRSIAIRARSASPTSQRSGGKSGMMLRDIHTVRGASERFHAGPNGE
jgi:hypothetical protein